LLPKTEGSGAPTGAGTERRARGPSRDRADLPCEERSPADDAGRRASRRSTCGFLAIPGRASRRGLLDLVRQPAPGSPMYEFLGDVKTKFSRFRDRPQTARTWLLPDVAEAPRSRLPQRL